MFRELKKNKLGNMNREEEMNHDVFSVPEVIKPPTKEDLTKKQEIIDSLVMMRYREEDNDFLRITEMNFFERIKVYQDSYPLLKFRMKLWGWYM